MTDHDQLLAYYDEHAESGFATNLEDQLAAALRAALAHAEEAELAMRAEVRLRSQHEQDLAGVGRPEPETQ